MDGDITVQDVIYTLSKFIQSKMEKNSGGVGLEENNDVFHL